MCYILRAQLAVLRDVQREYAGKTIDNIIVQLESRLKEAEKRASIKKEKPYEPTRGC